MSPARLTDQGRARRSYLSQAGSSRRLAPLSPRRISSVAAAQGPTMTTATMRGNDRTMLLLALAALFAFALMPVA